MQRNLKAFNDYAMKLKNIATRQEIAQGVDSSATALRVQEIREQLLGDRRPGENAASYLKRARLQRQTLNNSIADAVAELCAHEVPEVRAAAGRALATLGQQEPEDDPGPLRRFSRRARLRLASTEGMKVAPDPTQVLTITDLEIL